MHSTRGEQAGYPKGAHASTPSALLHLTQGGGFMTNTTAAALPASAASRGIIGWIFSLLSAPFHALFWVLDKAKIFAYVPTGILILVVYVGVTFLGGHDALYGAIWVGWTGADFPLTINAGVVMILTALLLMIYELWKSAQASHRGGDLESILSILLFAGELVLIATVPQFRSEYFVILMGIQFLDGIGGYIVRVAVARRDIAMEGGHALAGLSGSAG